MNNAEFVKIKTLYEAVNKIIEFTKGMDSVDELISNAMAWDAVKMNLVVIYETDLKINQKTKDKYNSVEWSQIKENKPIIENSALGFVPEEVWIAVTQKMEGFKKQLEKIL